MPRVSDYRGRTPTPLRKMHPRGGPAGVPGKRLIPKPRDQAIFIYEKDTSSKTLQFQMGIGDRGQMKALVSAMRTICKKTFEDSLSKPFREQDPDKFEEYMDACSKIRGLESYTDYWPAASYLRIYLKSHGYHEKHKERMAQVEPDDDLEDPALSQAKTASDRTVVEHEERKPEQGQEQEDIEPEPDVDLNLAPENSDDPSRAIIQSNAASTALCALFPPSLANALGLAGFTDATVLRTLGEDADARRRFVRAATKPQQVLLDVAIQFLSRRS